MLLRLMESLNWVKLSVGDILLVLLFFPFLVFFVVVGKLMFCSRW